MSPAVESVESQGHVRRRLSASLLRADSPLRWRGKVEIVSLDAGIEGWALDLDSPEVALRVLLKAGEDVVAETLTGLRRYDVVALLGAETSPGFRFPAETFRTLEVQRSKAPLSVVLAEENMEVLGDTLLPSVSQLLEAEPAPLIGFDITERLGSLREASNAICALPLRPSATKETGFIEIFAIDASGFVWLQGWMNRSAVVDAPAVVVDGRKEPAGFSYTFFERDDLDSARCGFVGVLHTAWVPSLSTTPILFLKCENLVHLRCVNPVRIVKYADFVASFRKLMLRCHTGQTAALSHLIDHPDTWTPGESQDSVALDSGLIIPGFGCILSGWVVDPSRAAVRFSLRVGSSVAKCDEASLLFRSRTDLANVAPGCDPLLARAGFVAVFRGPLDFRKHSTFKVFYEDGTASCHAIDTKVLKKIGTSVNPESLLALYPALYAESFFGDLASALREQDRSLAASWKVLKPASLNTAIVHVLSSNRSNLYHLAEQIRAQLVVDDGFGVILISDDTTNRSDALLLCESLTRTTGIACALIVARRPSQSLYALDSMLSALDCVRFVYLGPGIFLTNKGWRAARNYLQSTRDVGCFFGVNDPCSEVEENTRSAAAFGWTRDSLTMWLRTAPSLLGGLAGDNGLSRHLPGIYRSAAWFAKPLDGTPFERAVNRLAL